MSYGYGKSIYNTDTTNPTSANVQESGADVIFGESGNVLLSADDLTPTLNNQVASKLYVDNVVGAGGPATALKTTGASVSISGSAPPTTGQVLKATSATTAIWQASGSTETLEQTYVASSQPQITVNATQLGLKLKSAAVGQDTISHIISEDNAGTTSTTIRPAETVTPSLVSANIAGSIVASNDLTLQSTQHATKGNIILNVDTRVMANKQLQVNEGTETVTIAGLTCTALFTSDLTLDAIKSVGPFAPTANVGVTQSGGYMVLTGGGIKYIEYDKANCVVSNEFTYRCGWRPNFTGNPASLYQIFSIISTSGNNNVCRLGMATNGTISLVIFDSTSTNGGSRTIPNTLGFSAVSGTTYDLEINVSTTTGIYRVFMNGALFGKFVDTPMTRTSVMNNFRFGWTSNTPNFDLDYFMIYSNIQHLSDGSFTPSDPSLPITTGICGLSFKRQPLCGFTNSNNPSDLSTSGESIGVHVLSGGINKKIVGINPQGLEIVPNTSDLYTQGSTLTSKLASKANTSHNHTAAEITSGTLVDARVAASNVTQHISDTLINGKALTGWAPSVSTAVQATDSILQGLQKTDKFSRDFANDFNITTPIADSLLTWDNGSSKFIDQDKSVVINDNFINSKLLTGLGTPSIGALVAGDSIKSGFEKMSNHRALTRNNNIMYSVDCHIAAGFIETHTGGSYTYTPSTGVIAITSPNAGALIVDAGGGLLTGVDIGSNGKIILLNSHAGKEWENGIYLSSNWVSGVSLTLTRITGNDNLTTPKALCVGHIAVVTYDAGTSIKPATVGRAYKCLSSTATAAGRVRLITNNDGTPSANDKLEYSEGVFGNAKYTDDHIQDATLHRKIDDATPSATTTFSSNKTNTLVTDTAITGKLLTNLVSTTTGDLSATDSLLVAANKLAYKTFSASAFCTMTTTTASVSDVNPVLYDTTTLVDITHSAGVFTINKNGTYMISYTVSLSGNYNPGTGTSRRYLQSWIECNGTVRVANQFAMSAGTGTVGMSLNGHTICKFVATNTLKLVLNTEEAVTWFGGGIDRQGDLQIVRIA